MGKKLLMKMETGWNPAGNSEIVISRILKRFDCTKEAIVNSVSTGYGRNYFPFEPTVYRNHLPCIG